MFLYQLETGVGFYIQKAFRRSLICFLLLLLLAFHAGAQDFQWVRPFQGTNTSASYTPHGKMAVAPDGSYYMMDFLKVDITVAGTTLVNTGVATTYEGAYGIYIVKYDAFGYAQWAKKIEGTTNAVPGDLATDAAGNLYVLGTFTGQISFGANTYQSLGNFHDIFLAKYDANGNVLNATALQDINGNEANAIALDNAGGIYITGNFLGTGFIKKYNALFQQEWSQSFGTGVSWGNALKVAAPNDVYLAVNFQGNTVTFGSIVYTAAPPHSNDVNVAITRLKDGVWQWVTGTDINGSASSLVLTAAGPVIGGSYAGATHLGSFSMPANYGYFVAQLSPTGGVMWVNSTNQTTWASCTGLATDGTYIYASGNFTGIIPVNNTPLTSGTALNGFVLNLNTSGAAVSGMQYGNLPGNAGASADGIVYNPFNHKLGIMGETKGPVAMGSNIIGDTDPNTLNPFIASLYSGQVKLIEPQGGTYYWGHDYMNIAWESSGVSSIKVEYTLDGNTWTTIGGNYPPSYGVSIPLPNIAAQNCYARVSDASNAAVYDQSAPFAIKPLHIQVTTPNGGEQLVGGSVYTIRWTSERTTNKYRLSYSTDNGQTWSIISSSPVQMPNNFQWTVPNINSNACRVKVEDYNGTGAPGDAMDISDGPFSVSPGPPSVTGGVRCGPGTVTLSADGAGSSYRWYTASGGDFVGEVTTHSFTTPVLSATTDFYVTTVFNGVESGRATVTATINPLPAAPLSTGITLDVQCNKTLVTAPGAPAGETYYWQSGAESTDATNAAAVLTVMNPGTIWLRGYNNATGCWGASTPVVVTIKSCIDQQNINYVLTNTLRTEGIQSASQLEGLGVESNAQQISYIDGLGRPVQQVNVQASAGRQDVVVLFGYDAQGREPKKYLPYTTPGGGLYQTNGLAGLTNFYSTAGPSSDRPVTGAPWAETIYEGSPLNRIIAQGAPGESWQYTNGHAIKTSQAGNDAYEVRQWDYDFATGQCSTHGYYAAGALLVTETIDEDGHISRQYSNKQGKIILLKKLVTDTLSAQTYFIFDDFGRLRMAIQPQGVAELTHQGRTWTIDDAFIAKWCFTYKYDALGRVTEKKMPGAAPEFFVYNQQDQVILNQDGELRKQNQWNFTRYDGLKRVVMTGLYTHPEAVSQVAMQQAADNMPGQYESRTVDNYATQYGYTITQSFPVLNAGNSDIQKVSYYDDYDYDFNPGTVDAAFKSSGLSADPVVSLETRSLVTGSRVRVLGTDKMLLTSQFYDKWGHIIQSQQQNNLGGTDIVTSRYNFPGDLLESEHFHNTTSQSVRVKKQYDYDHAGRQLKLQQQINFGSWVTLSASRYNELGQQVEKKLHSTDNGQTYLQKIDYRYNIRGWLNSINDASLSESDDLFGMELVYGYSNVNEIQYNDKRDNQPKSYTFTYDALNRLTGAGYAAKGASGWDQQVDAFNEEGISYDLNGNINGLRRYALLNGQTTRQKIDDLQYSYDGNRLIKVEDAGSSLGFVNGVSLPVEYGYDANGNLQQDANKKLEVMAYNHLNELEEVDKEDGSNMYFIYDADGTLLSKSVYDAATGAQTSKDYDNGFEYNNGQLAFFATEEGRVSLQGNSFNYEYNLKDHLGDVRVSFDRDPQTGKARIIQKNSYYPFGGVQPGNGYVSGEANNYLYNGKELQEELGLNLYNYGARMYDGFLGRWNGVDVLAEKYAAISPYAYTMNNPVKYVDPNGNEIWIYLLIYEGDEVVSMNKEKVQYKEGQLYTGNGKKYGGDNKFALTVRDHLNKLAGASDFLKVRLTTLEKSKNVHAIQANSFSQATPNSLDDRDNGISTGSRVDYNYVEDHVLFEKENGEVGSIPTLPYFGLAHELLGHSYNYETGTTNMGTTENGVRMREVQALNIENLIKAAFKYPKKTSYGGKEVPPELLWNTHEKIGPRREDGSF